MTVQCKPAYVKENYSSMLQAFCIDKQLISTSLSIILIDTKLSLGCLIKLHFQLSRPYICSRPIRYHCTLRMHCARNRLWVANDEDCRN